MAVFQARRKKGNKWRSWAVLAVTFLAVIFLSHVTWQMYTRYRFTKEERVKAEETLAHLEERESALAGVVAALNTESGVEQAVREKFSVVKPGEFVVNIVERENEATSSEVVEIKKKTWWQFWKD